MIKSPVGVSLSSTVFMTFTEFTSWSGPQSDHAFSPKCRSAKTAILNAAPARIWTYLSPACTWSSNPTVRMKREKKVKDKIATWVWVCGLFNSIERREEKRSFFFFWGNQGGELKSLKKKNCNREYVRKWLWNKKNILIWVRSWTRLWRKQRKRGNCSSASSLEWEKEIWAIYLDFSAVWMEIIESTFWEGRVSVFFFFCFFLCMHFNGKTVVTVHTIRLLFTYCFILFIHFSWVYLW